MIEHDQKSYGQCYSITIKGYENMKPPRVLDTCHGVFELSRVDRFGQFAYYDCPTLGVYIAYHLNDKDDLPYAVRSICYQYATDWYKDPDSALQAARKFIHLTPED